MVRHYDFDSSRVGLIEDAIQVGADIFKFATSIFGKDEVANYPIKLSSTLESLKRDAISEVGMVVVNGTVFGTPPTTVEQAKIMLGKAKAQYDRYFAIQAGRPGYQTLVMFHGDTIKLLEAYIAAGGKMPQTTYPGGSLPTGGGTYIPPTTPGSGSNFFTNTGLFGLPNWVLLGGGAFAVYYFTKKKRRR